MADSIITAPNRISLLLLRLLLLRALWSDFGFALDLELDVSFTSLAFGLDGFAALRRRPKVSVRSCARAKGDVVRRRSGESTAILNLEDLPRNLAQQLARHPSLLHALAMRCSEAACRPACRTPAPVPAPLGSGTTLTER
ncbi:hypothetical protein K438DRAFT_1881956, partial [Mycena galopus ATCC 62051]